MSRPVPTSSGPWTYRRRTVSALVFGEQTLRRIADSGETKSLKIVALGVDFGTDQVEHILAAVGVVKGTYEWNGEAHTLPAYELDQKLRSWTSWGTGKSGGGEPS
jgi:hypothetical protein